MSSGPSENVYGLRFQGCGPIIVCQLEIWTCLWSVYQNRLENGCVRTMNHHRVGKHRTPVVVLLRRDILPPFFVLLRHSLMVLFDRRDWRVSHRAVFEKTRGRCQSKLVTCHKPDGRRALNGCRRWARAKLLVLYGFCLSERWRLPRAPTLQENKQKKKYWSK